MRRLRKMGLALYAVAATLVVLACAGSLFGPYQERFASMLTSGSGRVTMAICLVVIVLHLLVVVVRLLFDRPEPTCLRLAGNEDIEVSVDALASIARSAASSRDVMVEDVRVRIGGRDMAAADIRLEVIALAQTDVNDLAHRVQQRVQAACDEMLGATGARVRVRFLPSKTVTIRKEAAGER